MAEEEDGWLFDPSEFPPVARNASGGVALAPLNHPLWTEHKAALILRYLRYFVYITKHGTYIDGFAGSQNDLPGMWAAQLVIESEPRRLRHFHLVELDKEKIPALNALKAKADAITSPKRSIDIYQGDFNVVVDKILEAGTITPKEATFCLLDQRTFECHWATLEKLARYKPAGESKIELFYFLSNSWLDRALAATKNEVTLLSWWGRSDAKAVFRGVSSHRRAELFADRIRRELGYASVLPWPIYERKGGDRIMYYMIHATDHPEAPKLMRRAYSRAVDPLEPIAQFKLAWDAGLIDQ
jgi:three-Cys-motif partner protein